MNAFSGRFTDYIALHAVLTHRFGCGILLPNTITDDVVVALLFGAKKKKGGFYLRRFTSPLSGLLNVRILAISGQLRRSFELHLSYAAAQPSVCF